MNRLRELRTQHSLSQRKLGELLNASQNTVSQWETGVREMDFTTAIAIAEYFGCSVDYLLCRSAPQQKESIHMDELSPILVEMLKSLTEDEVRRVQDFVAGMKAARTK